MGLRKLRADREVFELERAIVAAEFRKLDQVRRIRAIYLAARSALRAEMARNGPLSSHDIEEHIDWAKRGERFP
jgi:hypothetical protein